MLVATAELNIANLRVERILNLLLLRCSQQFAPDCIDIWFMRMSVRSSVAAQLLTLMLSALVGNQVKTRDIRHRTDNNNNNNYNNPHRYSSTVSAHVSTFRDGHGCQSRPGAPFVISFIDFPNYRWPHCTATRNKLTADRAPSMINRCCLCVSIYFNYDNSCSMRYLIIVD